VNRRSFIKLGALFVPAVAAPTVAYSFLWAKPNPFLTWDLSLSGTTSRTNYTILEFGTGKILARGTIHHPAGLGDGIGGLSLVAGRIDLPIGTPFSVREVRYGGGG
jgi:hypothetical protein